MGIEQLFDVDIIVIFTERMAGHTAKLQPRIKQEELRSLKILYRTVNMVVRSDDTNYSLL